MSEPTYSADQIAIAARELRQAAGTDEERLPLSRALSLLQNEIRLLRERGFTDAAIADLLSGFDIEVTADQLSHHALPLR
jgi:hypothetical protein